MSRTRCAPAPYDLFLASLATCAGIPGLAPPTFDVRVAEIHTRASASDTSLLL